MPRNKKDLLALLAALAVLLGIAIASLPSYSQGKSTAANQPQAAKDQNQSGSKSVTPKEPQGPLSVNSTASPAFVSAALQNATLRTNLDWVFGGKQQHGWYLYTPLICGMIGTEKDPATEDFAQALSRWQQAAGLVPSGILDTETWYRIVQTLQDRRSKDHTYPPSDQLLMAPPSDFYIPERPAALRQVERQAYAAYKRMVAAAAADPSLKLAVTSTGELAPSEKFLKIVSAFRSREYQEQLRRQSPNAGRAGLAVNSPHFTGRAMDLYVGGDPVDTSDFNRAIQTSTPVYKWLVKNAEKFGFYPYYYEPWHWEYQPQ